MRTIKFRAWDTQYGKWAYFDLSHLIEGEIVEITQRSKHWCQFVGIKDSVGKEIYEGDILVIRTHRDHIVTVEWDRGGFSLFEGSRPFASVAYAGNRKKQGEVIGNVYQNAGFLK